MKNEITKEELAFELGKVYSKTIDSEKFKSKESDAIKYAVNEILSQNSRLAKVSCLDCDYKEWSEEFRGGDKCPHCASEIVQIKS